MRMLGLAAVAVCIGASAPAVAQAIGHMTPAEPLTEARIATLPATERGPWLAYLRRSRAQMQADQAALAAERAGLAAAAIPAPPPEGSTRTMPLDRQASWYAGEEARRIADNIVSFQTPAGGWGKNQDRSGPPRARRQHYVIVEHLPPMAKGDIQARDAKWVYVGTIDNGATTTEMRFLARAQQAWPGAQGEAYRQAFLRGVRYLLAAQYPNGGWPQIYPVEGGYHDAITFNDDAMADVIGLLLDVSRRQGDYGFVPAEVAAQAKTAVDCAVDVILATQVVVGGKRTGWGQQHDMLTLAPAGARNFEPTSLSSNESAGLLALLMRLPERSPRVDAAIEAGIAWLRSVAIRDMAWTSTTPAEGRRLVARPGAGPIWARFYDIATMRPIFGDRDRSIQTDVNAVSLERRNGYSWFGAGPGRVIQAYDAGRAAR
ncbi:MAG: pectate lyase [Sphingomonas sp.]|uniref:pectate lyase n=1 Tax=Sphingomonas sp. TaxID=28214 RepID=UPI001B2C8D16|nr:pectate lyase [Sphingomonas sp.]MBO9622483.1 pectate lyase [Sphingomonas sp.]